MRNPRRELTLTEWKRCLDMLWAEKIEVIELFGGDALLRKEVLIPLIEYIREKDNRIVIDFPTNGNLLDQATAKRLVQAGLTRVYLSLDGPREIHDLIRGVTGTFDQAKRGLEYLIQAKKSQGSNSPEIVCNCTISSLNVEHFEEVIPLAETIGVDCVEFEYVGEINQNSIQNTKVNGLTPTPFYVSQGPSILLKPKQALLLKQKMRDIRESEDDRNVYVNTRHIDILSIDNLIKGTIPNKKCYICRYMVSIDPFGNVMGCFHFNNYHFGNIKDEPLRRIWNNIKHRDFREFQRKGEIKICRHCISGVHRNPTFFQSIARKAYFAFREKG